MHASGTSPASIITSKTQLENRQSQSRRRQRYTYSRACVLGDYVAGTSFSRQFATRFRRPKVLINHFVNYVGSLRMCCLSTPQHHRSLFYGALKIVLLELYIVTMGSSGMMRYDGPISGLHVYLTCFTTPVETRLFYTFSDKYFANYYFDITQNDVM